VGVDQIEGVGRDRAGSRSNFASRRLPILPPIGVGTDAWGGFGFASPRVAEHEGRKLKETEALRRMLPTSRGRRIRIRVGFDANDFFAKPATGPRTISKVRHGLQSKKQA